MRLLFSKQYGILGAIFKYARRIDKKQLATSITGDHVTPLNDKTLTGRLLIYLNNNENCQKTTFKVDDTLNVLTILKSKDTNNLGKINTQEIILALCLIANPDHFRNRYEFLKLLNILDTECCKRLEQLNTKDTLGILNAFMHTIPNRIVEYRFYNLAIDKLVSKAETLSKSDLVQLIFFVGLQKKTVQSQKMQRKCLKCLNEIFINNLTTEELCIICNSTHKTSTKINNTQFLNTIITYLTNNLGLLKDPAFFITFVKTIRQNYYQNLDFLTTISCAILFNKILDHYSFPALCHTLALYSDFLYYDETLMKEIYNRSLEQLRNNQYSSKHVYFEEQPRMKDIKRFLWCLSNLNYKDMDKSDIKTVIISNIIVRVEAGELNKDPSSLIEIILYLWMLNYRAYELIPYALTNENIHSIRALKSKTKHRLNLLLSCIYFEDRKLFRDINIHPQASTDYDINVQLQKRPLIQRILNCLKAVSTRHEISTFKITCQVPFLNIIGITGFRKKIYKAVNIEVLDGYTTMKNTNSLPSGLMQLKLRILDGFEEGLVVVEDHEIDEMSDSELQNFLLDEINLVC